MRAVRIAVALIAVLAAAACAARRPQPPPTPASVTPAVDVDALLRRGCFRCFEQALTAARAAGDGDRAFEAAALVALRAKELGLPTAARMDTLRTLLPDEPGWDI